MRQLGLGFRLSALLTQLLGMHLLAMLHFLFVFAASHGVLHVCASCVRMLL